MPQINDIKKQVEHNQQPEENIVLIDNTVKFVFKISVTIDVLHVFFAIDSEIISHRIVLTWLIVNHEASKKEINGTRVVTYATYYRM